MDSDWIEPKNSGGSVVYHFGSSRGSTDWYSADAYCSEKGGYLAEPSTAEENSFIVNYARFDGAAVRIGCFAENKNIFSVLKFGGRKY